MISLLYHIFSLPVCVLSSRVDAGNSLCWIHMFILRRWFLLILWDMILPMKCCFPPWPLLALHGSPLEAIKINIGLPWHFMHLFLKQWKCQFFKSVLLLLLLWFLLCIETPFPKTCYFIILIFCCYMIIILSLQEFGRFLSRASE